jgi:hypothetical protein
VSTVRFVFLGLRCRLSSVLSPALTLLMICKSPFLTTTCPQKQNQSCFLFPFSLFQRKQAPPQNHEPSSWWQLVGVAETDCLLVALARLRLVRWRNWFYKIPTAYVALHILFNHATSPMRLSTATTKVSFVFYPTPYIRRVAGSQMRGLEQPAAVWAPFITREHDLFSGVWSFDSNRVAPLGLELFQRKPFRPKCRKIFRCFIFT